MGQLLNALIVVSCISVLMFMAQVSIDLVNPTTPTQFYKCNENPLMQDFENSKCSGSTYNLDKSNNSVTAYLPTTGGAVEVSTGNFFVDLFSTFKSWISAGAKGFVYVMHIVFAPAGFISKIFPSGFEPYVFGLGVLFQMVLLFLVINWIKGGDA
jgi:hypothetical protein